MREKVLLVGEPNTSKTLSLVSLAILYPDSRVVIFDPDDGTGKVIAELGVELPNLTIVPVTPNWEELMDCYDMVKAVLTENDWLCLDMVGRFWDLAQQYYSTKVFGESPVEHMLRLRQQASRVDFGGFDGLNDWSLIKRLHNEKLMDDAVLWSSFNVMCTTAAGQYLPIEKLPKTGISAIYASEFGIKPEGEKHNIYRFDTQLVLYRKKDNTYWFRIVRDRGRNVNIKQEFEITGKSAWEVYCEYRDINL